MDPTLGLVENPQGVPDRDLPRFARLATEMTLEKAGKTKAGPLGTLCRVALKEYKAAADVIEVGQKAEDTSDLLMSQFGRRRARGSVITLISRPSFVDRHSHQDRVAWGGGGLGLGLGLGLGTR